MKVPEAGNEEREFESFFEARPEVLLAYLFGSRARGEAGQGSDYDFGVLLQDVDRAERRHEMAHRLRKLTGAGEVDVIVLNGAPVELAFNVIAEGRLLYERDVPTRVEFEARTMSMYADFLPVLRKQREDVLRESGA